MLPPIIEGYLNLLTGTNRDLMEVRVVICQRCDYFGALGNCNYGCNCIMKAKASITNAKCPLKKW